MMYSGDTPFWLEALDTHRARAAEVLLVVGALVCGTDFQLFLLYVSTVRI